MIKISKLQLNQPDATAAHPDRNHAEIIADAQHAAGLDAGSAGRRWVGCRIKCGACSAFEV
jgi:hypothetical protein